MKKGLEHSPALWNRICATLESDETLAQLLDRGNMADWRELYRLASSDATLRVRIKRIILTLPLPMPHFWLAALANLGEPIDWNVPLPNYLDSAI